MNALETVNQQIIEAQRARRGGGLERRRVWLIRAIDDVMSDLEEFHLAGRTRLPVTYEPRVGDVTALLDEGDHDVAGQSIAHVMGVLFDIQERLLAEKTAALFGAEIYRPRSATG